MRNPFNLYKDLVSINQKRKNLFNTLEGFSSDESSMIDLETLRSLNVGEWHAFVGGRYKLARITKDEAIFITEMDAGGTFGLHEHDCIERGIVIEGHLLDDLNGLKILKNETWEYKIDQEHTPYSKVKSIYKVVFTEN